MVREPRAIVSAQAGAVRHALRELRGIDAIEELGPGVTLVALPETFDTWARKLVDDRPVFVRHVCPVHATAQLAIELEDYRMAVASLVDRIEAHDKFAAQINLTGESVVGRHRLRAAAHDVVTTAVDVEISIPAPEQVLSVVVSGATAYLGVSRADLNLSAWPGGMRRYAREPGQVSRSEFKLLEAIEAFGIDLSSHEHALDLGAAPGGWSRILAAERLHVVAIDPAQLDPSVASVVTHHRAHAQAVPSLDLPRFDLVVNDMRMDARDSARVMTSMRASLADRGEAVMTLKLPKQKTVPTLRAVTDILREIYEVTSVRQLFHNRNEVTAHLRW